MGNTTIDYINRDIVNVKEELRSISKIVRDGNGVPGLVVQVATLKKELSSLEESLNDLETTLTTQVKEVHDKVHVIHNHVKKREGMSWQFKSVIGAAIITSVTSIALQLIDNSHVSDRTLQLILQKVDALESERAPVVPHPAPSTKKTK